MSGPGGTQGVLDGMPPRLYPCTPTRLATWRHCPRRYRYAYLDRPQPPKGPPWAHTSVGAATHVALARWWALPVRGRTPTAGADLVRRGWLRDGFRDGAQEAQARERAASWVQAYLDPIDPAIDPLGVERAVAVRTESLVLSGRVDRLDVRPGGRVAVVDYKTGRLAPDPHQVGQNLALTVYAVAAASTVHRPCTTVELHHLPTGARAVAEHTPQSLGHGIQEAETLARGAAEADRRYRRGDTGDEDFPARASAACSWCDWRGGCGPGRAASPELAPWAGLAT